MENNKPQLGENEPVDPSGFHPRRASESVQELNRFVEAFPGQAPVYPIDGDAVNRRIAAGLTIRLREIVRNA